QPHVALEPGLRPAQAPGRAPGPRAEGAGKEHEAVPDEAVEEPDQAAPRGPVERAEVIRDVGRGGQDEDEQGGPHPAAMAPIDDHGRMDGGAPRTFEVPVAKNSRGSTRMAAPCGQAYTQLGSFSSVQRSQPVAFSRTTAFLPVWPSAVTLKGCMLMFPYGHCSAHRPQPMHQSSMRTSREFLRRMEPNGQPIMHSGSRHDRQDVVTRYLSYRSPSRMSRVTPSWASAQARTQASHRTQRSRSIRRRFCASMSPWRRNSSSGTSRSRE